MMTRLLVITLSYVLTITIIFSGLYAIMLHNGMPQAKDNQGTGKVPVADNLSHTENKGEISAVWIATVSNINYPSRAGLSAPELMSELDAIVESVAELGAGAIFFQVRPCADALYKSDLFVQSEYISGIRGEAADGGFDSLDYIIGQAHRKGIALHAWINPVRVLSGTPSSPAKREELCRDESAYLHPEWVVEYADGSLYYDLGIPEVRNMIADGVYEIVSRYDVDGVVFDDYFYPYPVKDSEGNTVEFDDAATYKKYGGSLSLGDFRRSCVQTLVRICSISVKKADKECMYGIAPFGIWKNDTADGGAGTSGLESYYDIWCDTLSFAQEGCVDYIAPQLYWEIGYDAADFLTLAKWWSEQLSKTSAAFIPCLAPYRYTEGRYKTGELSRQLEYVRTLPSYKGIALYGYAALTDKSLSVFDEAQDFLRSE